MGVFDGFNGLGSALGLDNLTGQKGYETAAQGAREAQQRAQNMSSQAWARQMQGLGLAQQSLQPYRTLYDQIYGTNTASSVPQIPDAIGQAPAVAPMVRGMATGAYNPAVHGTGGGPGISYGGGQPRFGGMSPGSPTSPNAGTGRGSFGQPGAPQASPAPAPRAAGPTSLQELLGQQGRRGR